MTMANRGSDAMTVAVARKSLASACDDLDDAVRAKRVELGEAYDFSVSFGSVVANADELGDIDELLARTDQRMYRAKRERRRKADGSGAGPRAETTVEAKAD